MALFKNLKKGIGSMPKDRRPGRRPTTPRINIEQLGPSDKPGMPTVMPIGPGHPLYDPPKDDRIDPGPRPPAPGPRPPRDISIPRQPLMPPPWFQQQNNMGLVQGAPAGNRVAEMYNRAPSVNSLVNPRRTDPGGQEDRQKMMDMQRQMYRRFLAPPPPGETPPETPPVTPPVTPGEPPITLPPGYPPIRGPWDDLPEMDFDELEEKYGFNPEDYMQNGDLPVGPQPGDIGSEWLDFYKDQDSGGLPSLMPNGIPEIDLSGIDLSQIGAPEIDLSGLEEKYGFSPADVLPPDVMPGSPGVPMEPDFDPNIMVPRGPDREMPVGIPEPVGIPAALPQMPAEIPQMPNEESIPFVPPPPEMIDSIEQTPQLYSPSTPMPMPMAMAPEEVEQAKQVIPSLPPEQIQQVIPQLPPEVIPQVLPQLPPEQIQQVLPSLPPEVIEQVLPMLPPEVMQPPAAPMPAISSYFPPMPVAPVSPKVSPVRRPARRGGRGGRTSKNLGGIVNSMGSMPLKYTYK